MNGESQLPLFAAGGASLVPEVAPAGAALRALGRRLPDALRLGTSSWSFPGWAGLVYESPYSTQVLARRGLAAYASHPLLRCVSVDRTFYAPLGAAAFRDYAAAVPADFRFVVKGCRDAVQARVGGVANPRFLDPAYAAQELVAPCLEGCGEKVAVMVWAFPPQPAAMLGGVRGFAERLYGFLSRLPRGVMHAVELRTPELLVPDYVEAVHAAGAVHCFNVHPKAPPLGRQWHVVRTRRWPLLLVRWMLRRNLSYTAARERYRPFDRLVDEDTATRRDVAALCQRAVAAGRPAFVVANNKAEGSAPLTLQCLAELLDKSAKKS